MQDLSTVFLFILTIMNGYNLLNQKNQREDFKELSGKLEKWIEEFIALKQDHKRNHHHGPEIN